MYFGQVAIVYKKCMALLLKTNMHVMYFGHMHGTVALKHMHVMYFGQGAILYLAHMHGTVASNKYACYVFWTRRNRAFGYFGQDAIVYLAHMHGTVAL